MGEKKWKGIESLLCPHFPNEVFGFECPVSLMKFNWFLLRLSEPPMRASFLVPLPTNSLVGILAGSTLSTKVVSALHLPVSKYVI